MRPKSQSLLEKVNDNASSLRIAEGTRKSTMSNDLSLHSTLDAVDFDFDTEIINTTTYRRAFHMASRRNPVQDAPGEAESEVGSIHGQSFNSNEERPDEATQCPKTIACPGISPIGASPNPDNGIENGPSESGKTSQEAVEDSGDLLIDLFGTDSQQSNTTSIRIWDNTVHISESTLVDLSSLDLKAPKTEFFSNLTGDSVRNLIARASRDLELRQFPSGCRVPVGLDSSVFLYTTQPSRFGEPLAVTCYSNSHELVDRRQ